MKEERSINLHSEDHVDKQARHPFRRQRARLTRAFFLATMLACLTHAPSLLAQTNDEANGASGEDKTIQTRPPDANYSRVDASLTAPIPGMALEIPPVDRRDEVDPLAVQGALFPTAHIPEERRFVYRNHLVFGNQLSARVLDDLMIDVLTVVSPGSLGWNAGGDIDRRLALQARYRIFQTDDLSVAVQGGLQHQKGLYKLDTSVLGAHLSAMLDYKLSDRLILGAGLLGNLPLQLKYTDEDTSRCESRGDFIEGSCIDYIEESRALPPGGQFVMGWLGLTLYTEASIYLKGEVFSALRRGTIWGLEGALYNDQRLGTELARYESTQFAGGPVKGAPFGVTLGVGYTLKERLAIQLTLITLPGALPERDNRDDGFVGTPPHIFPMSTIGLTF